MESSSNTLYDGKGEMTEFIKKIQNSDDILQEAIDKGFNLYSTYKAIGELSGNIIAETKPLHLAAQFGRINAVKNFLKRGLDINMKDDSGIVT